MHDNAVSISKLVTAALWAWVLLLFAAAWTTWLLDDGGDIWMMLAFTGCASSALAATAQVRCYSLRICGLLLATTSASPAEVRSLR